MILPGNDFAQALIERRSFRTPEGKNKKKEKTLIKEESFCYFLCI